MAMNQTVLSYVAVAVGGAVGALGRLAIMESGSESLGAAATSMLIVNVLGCALLGAVVALGEREFVASHVYGFLWRPALGAGALGGFTSTSSFAVISEQLGGSHGVLYALFSAFAGLAAYAIVHGALRRT